MEQRGNNIKKNMDFHMSMFKSTEPKTTITRSYVTSFGIKSNLNVCLTGLVSTQYTVQHPEATFQHMKFVYQFSYFIFS